MKRLVCILFLLFPVMAEAVTGNTIQPGVGPSGVMPLTLDNVLIEGVSSQYYDPTSSIQGQLDTKQTSDSTLSDLIDESLVTSIRIEDDVTFRFGNDNDFKYRFNPSTIKLETSLDNGFVLRTLDKSGNVVYTGEVTASQYNSLGTDGTFGINVMNSSNPTGGNLEAGLFWFLSTTNVPMQRNADNTATYQYLTSSIAKFSKCIAIDNAVNGSDYPIENFPQAITITRVKVYSLGDNVVGGLDECTGTNGACTSTTPVDSDITAGDGVVAFDDGSISNPVIAAENWIRWHTTSHTGTNVSLSVCFFYTLDSAN